jgi:hypothetical protein
MSSCPVLDLFQMYCLYCVEPKEIYAQIALVCKKIIREINDRDTHYNENPSYVFLFWE